MPYGTVKVDTVIYTFAGLDASGTISGVFNGNFPSVQAIGAISGATGTFNSGLTVQGGNVTLNAQSPLRFADADSSNWVALSAPAIIGTNVTWTLPSGDGTSNQFLKTDGSGNLNWAVPTQAVTKSMAYFYAGF